MTGIGERDGIFIKVFEILENKYNLGIEYKSFKPREHMTNMIYYDAVGPIVSDDNNAKYYQPMNNFFTVGYTFLVPPGKGIPLALSPFRVFPIIMWVLIIVTYILATLTFWLLERHRDVSDLMLNTLGAQLGASMQQTFSGIAPITFFILWLFYCLLVSILHINQ